MSNCNFKKEDKPVPHLVIFTETEDCPFMDRELPFLKINFDFITIYPIRKLDSSSSTIRKHITNSVNIDGSFATYINNVGTKIFFLLNAATRPSTYVEIWRCRRNAAIIPSMRRVLIDSAFFLATNFWLCKKMHLRNWGEITPIFYGFWFAPYTYALANFAERNAATCIARAHGYDIFLERTEVNYFPLRHRALKQIDHVFVASEAGTKYLQESWPEYRSKFSCSYLGVADPKFRNPTNSSSDIRIVSCSNIVDVKRVQLIAEVMILLAQRLPNLALTWTHIGDGPQLDQVLQALQDTNVNSLNWELIGRKSREEIESIYSKVPIDLFINLSSTEGGAPVSIMEAMSYGIPVLATEVGGNSEIVDATTGALVPSNSNVVYLVNRISQMLADRTDLNSKRDQCYEKWKNCFDSETNYPLFIDSIHQILATKRDIVEFNSFR